MIQAVWQSVTRRRCANTAEQIEVLLCVENLPGDLRNTVLNASPDFLHGLHAAPFNF